MTIFAAPDASTEMGEARILPAVRGEGELFADYLLL